MQAVQPPRIHEISKYDESSSWFLCGILLISELSCASWVSSHSRSPSRSLREFTYIYCNTRASLSPEILAKNLRSPSFLRARLFTSCGPFNRLRKQGPTERHINHGRRRVKWQVARSTAAFTVSNYCRRVEYGIYISRGDCILQLSRFAVVVKCQQQIDTEIHNLVLEFYQELFYFS